MAAEVSERALAMSDAQEKQAHSELPWVVDERAGCIAIYPASKDYNCLDIPERNFIHYKHGKQVDGSWRLSPEVRANAALIVRAANSFYAMRDALEWYGNPGNYVPRAQPGNNRAAPIKLDRGAVARAALAAAKEKTP